jgi:hypothetical protein
MFPIWSDINLCFGLLFSIMISLAFGFAILPLKSGSERPGDFYNQLQLVAMSSRLAYRNWLEHSKTKQTPKCPFSRNSISSHLFEISLKLTIICYINLIKSITIINGWINISCTVDFSQNEPSFRNKSQWSSDSQNISYQFLNTGLSAWNIIPASSHNSDLAPQTP